MLALGNILWWRYRFIATVTGRKNQYHTQKLEEQRALVVNKIYHMSMTVSQNYSIHTRAQMFLKPVFHIYSAAKQPELLFTCPCSSANKSDAPLASWYNYTLSRAVFTVSNGLLKIEFNLKFHYAFTIASDRNYEQHKHIISYLVLQ